MIIYSVKIGWWTLGFCLENNLVFPVETCIDQSQKSKPELKHDVIVIYSWFWIKQQFKEKGKGELGWSVTKIQTRTEANDGLTFGQARDQRP